MAAFQFAVIHGDGKGPLRVQKIPSILLTGLIVHTGVMSNQDGAAVVVALCCDEPSRSMQSSREQPVLFLFYRNGGFGCKPLDFRLLYLALKIL